MKQVAIFLSIVYLLAGCSQNELTPEEERIVGTWQLSEYCISPGFGNCIPQPATAAISQTLEFRNNGSVIEKRPQPGRFQSPIVSSGDYKIDSNGKITFRFDNQTALAGEVEYGYKLSSKTLVIIPQCYEGCTYTYTKL